MRKPRRKTLILVTGAMVIIVVITVVDNSLGWREQVTAMACRRHITNVETRRVDVEGVLRAAAHYPEAKRRNTDTDTRA